MPLAVHETERAAQRELLSILRLADAGKIAVSDKTRRASAATIDAITAILEAGDYYPQAPPTDKWHDSNTGPIRAFAWPLLIQAGGLAQLAGTRLQLTKAGRKALSEPAAGTIRTLWTKWLNTTILDELARIECVKGQTGKGKRGLIAVSERRATIADGLAECPPGGWVAVDEFYRYMQATGADLAVACCGGGEQALRMSRRKWLERLGVSSLTAELLAFWKRNAHRMAPDPGGVMGADYKSCADWARALWEINPASCEHLLAQWSVVHQRRRNLWRALRTKGLPIPGKIGGHDLPSSRSRV